MIAMVLGWAAAGVTGVVLSAVGVRTQNGAWDIALVGAAGSFVSYAVAGCVAQVIQP